MHAAYAARVSSEIVPPLSRKPSAREAGNGVVRVGAKTLLRFAHERDGAGFIAMLSRSREHLTPWMPRSARHGEADSSTRFQRMLRPQADSLGRARMVVCALDDARMIGVASLGGMSDWPSLDCHIGYWLGDGEEGHGFMRDAVAALTDHAFEERQLHRVAANILPSNRRSHALVAALGFTREGIVRGLIEIDGAWRDHECWSMLSTEWRDGTLDRATDASSKRARR